MVAPLIAAALPTIGRMAAGSAARGAAGSAGGGGLGAAAQAFGKQALVSGAVRAATHRHGGGGAPADKSGGVLGGKGEALLAYAAMPSGPNLHESANQAYTGIIQPMQFGNR